MPTAAHQTPEPDAPRARRDAQRNRTKLITATRELFEEQGVEVPLDEIARRAGVGHGTLYRHFPSRQALVEAIFDERLEAFLTVCRTALERQDDRDGFGAFLEALLDLQTQDRVLRQIFVRYPPREGNLTGAVHQINDVLTQIIDRARRGGALRDDFTVADLMLLLWSFASLTDATADAAPEAWRRHLHFVLDGLRPAAATPANQPSLDERALAAVTDSLRNQRFTRTPPTRGSDRDSGPPGG